MLSMCILLARNAMGDSLLMRALFLPNNLKLVSFFIIIILNFIYSMLFHEVYLHLVSMIIL